MDDDLEKQFHGRLTEFCDLNSKPNPDSRPLFDLIRKSGDTVAASEFLVDLIWIFDLQFTELGGESGTRARERLHSLAQQLLEASLVTEHLLKTRLELEFLEKINLIDSAALWAKRAVRMNTTMLYKQKKFNLLREESEGYAKIVTELEINIRRNPTEEKLLSVQQIITSLIGYFNLDPNRVLDILLDVFSQNSTCVDFFLPLIRQSQWGLGGCEYLRPKLADLMGFKLSQHPNHRGHRTLYTAAALLIKQSLMSFEGLYAHLYPSDEQMAKDYERYVQQRKKGDLVAKSAQPAAVQQQDDSTKTSPAKTGESTATEDRPAPVEAERINQKSRLCQAMLMIGDLENALKLLQRFPGLPAFDPEIVPNLTRCMHYMIEPLYRKIRPASGQSREYTTALGAKRSGYIDSTATTRSSAETQRSQQQQQILELMQSKPEEVTTKFDLQLPSTHKRPFAPNTYPEFTAQLPLCETVQDLALHVLPLLNYIGCSLYKDPAMLTKLCRIIRWHLSSASTTQDHSISLQNWLFVLSTYILPSISMMPSNPAVVAEVWSIIKQLPYRTRFTLYGEWKNQSYDRYPELTFVRTTVVLETKKILRRISKDNYKKFSRVLARWGHSNPTVCFSTMLDQVQAYENLIGPVVDCYRCCTSLGFDVLVYLLVEALANPSKQRLKPDGTNIALWLNSLALFAGTLFKHHPEVDLTGLLFYIWHQGKAGNNFDLVVLKELVTQMTGIEQLTEGISDQQLEALCGGEILRSNILVPGGVKTVKKSSAGLVKALLDTRLAIPVAILLGKQRNACIFHTDIPHLKLLSSLLDQVHETLIQYVGFLRANFDKTEFLDISPSLWDLCNQYQLDPEVAWFIIRAKLDILVENDKTAFGSESRVKTVVDAMDLDSKQQESRATVTAQIFEDFSNGAPVPDCVMQASQATNVWLHSLQPYIMDSYRILPKETWKHISPHFYVTFWQLNLHDIYVPSERYESELAKLKANVHAIEHDPLIGTYQDTAANISKRNTDRQDYLDKIRKLELERKQHFEHVRVVMSRLQREKNHWFPGDGSNRLDIVRCILQYCIHPRSLFSGTDSLFSAKFVLLLHSLNAKNFSTLSFVERFVCDVACTVSLCTMNESMHYGRYMKEILSKLHGWHKNPDLFEKEAIGEGRLGFCKRWELPKPQSQEIAKAPSPKPADTEEPGEIVMTEATPVTTKPLDDSSTMQVDGDPSSGVAKAITGASEPKTPNIEAKDMLQYSDFRSVLHKWHVRLHKAFISCLESKDYIKMRNAIVVLDKISDYFPIIKQIGMHIEGKMAGILQAESREDLKLLLTRYDASLKRNSSKWIPIEQFHSVEKPHEAVAGKSETTGKPTMAQQATAKPPLPVDTKLPSNPKPPTETKLQATPASTSTTADQQKGDSSSLESNRILPARSASRQDLRRERKRDLRYSQNSQDGGSVESGSAAVSESSFPLAPTSEWSTTAVRTPVISNEPQKLEDRASPQPLEAKPQVPAVKSERSVIDNAVPADASLQPLPPASKPADVVTDDAKRKELADRLRRLESGEFPRGSDTPSPNLPPADIPPSTRSPLKGSPRQLPPPNTPPGGRGGRGPPPPGPSRPFYENRGSPSRPPIESQQPPRKRRMDEPERRPPFYDYGSRNVNPLPPPLPPDDMKRRKADLGTFPDSANALRRSRELQQQQQQQPLPPTGRRDGNGNYNDPRRAPDDNNNNSYAGGRGGGDDYRRDNNFGDPGRRGGPKDRRGRR